MLVSEPVAFVGLTGDHDDLRRLIGARSWRARKESTARCALRARHRAHRVLSFGHVLGQRPFQRHSVMREAVRERRKCGCRPTFISQMEIMGTNFVNNR